MLKPCGHRILVKPDNITEVDPLFEKAKKAGLDLSHSKELEREQGGVVIGTVVSIGPTAWSHPDLGGIPWCAVGDRVYYAKYSGKEITDNGEKFLVLNDEDIVAVFSEE